MRRFTALTLKALCLASLAGLALGGAMASGEPAVRMSEAAAGLLKSLDESERAALQFAWDAPARFQWSNLPFSMVEPDGLMVADMSDASRSALYRLLSASLSSQGYAKVASIMRSDDILRDTLEPQVAEQPQSDDEKFFARLAGGYASGNFGVAIYGDPEDDTWGWQLDGHHIGANFTVTDDRVAFTPLFLGSNPRRLETGPYAGWMPLPEEGRKGRDLYLSLDSEQRKLATLGDGPPGDIIAGPGQPYRIDAVEGLPGSRLNVAQMRLLRSLVGEYVLNAAGGIDFLAALEADDWEGLHFAWGGATGRDDVFYYRVHGPRLLIEYSRQDPNHEHTILRDPANDFGADWLGRHYQETHPDLDEVLRVFRERAGIVDD